MNMKNQQLNPNSKNPDLIKIVWFMFTSAIIVYNVIAVLIAHFQENFKGFVESNEDLVIGNFQRFPGIGGFVELSGDLISLLFYALLVLSVSSFVVALRYGEKVKTAQSAEDKQKFSVVSYACIETIAIYGLVLFLITGSFNYLFLFSGVAIITMLLVYPREVS